MNLPPPPSFPTQDDLLFEWLRAGCTNPVYQPMYYAELLRAPTAYEIERDVADNDSHHIHGCIRMMCGW